MRRWLHADLRLSRGRRWYVDITDRVARVLSVAVYAAAAVCPVIMLVYAGYDSDAVDRRLLLRILGVAQGVFLTDLIFNLVFRFRRTLEESRAVRRVAEAILADADTRTLPTTAGEHAARCCISFTVADFCLRLRDILCGGAVLRAMQLPGRRTNPSLLLSGSFLFFIVIGSLCADASAMHYGAHKLYRRSFHGCERGEHDGAFARLTLRRHSHPWGGL